MSVPKTKNFKYVSGKKYDGMMGRCYREADQSFPRYGGRGIRVAKAWIENIETFRLFLLEELSRLEVSVEEFTSKPGKFQLDRRDSDGHYTPENCRLVSMQQNARNKSTRVVHKVISAEGDHVCLDSLS
jgi:hypothetical protein